MEVYNPQRIKKADIVVGIPSYNEAPTIGFVAKQAARGLKEYFPQKSSVIVNVDNNSSDGTREAFLSSESETPLIYITTPQGIKGKGYNFHNLFSLFRNLKAKVGIVVDADLKSIEPIWIKNLAEPILSGYGYTAPFYARRKDDATITNQIVYPLVYGLLGVNLRQPIGGEFSFSSKLVDIWLNQEWSKRINQFGIDIFMSANAILSGAKICQVNLGRKVHKNSDPNLGPMFIQVAETFFSIISNNFNKIRKGREVLEIPILGMKDFPKIENTIPNWDKFESLFRSEFVRYKNIIKECVSESVLKKIENKEGPEINIDVWTNIVYNFIYCFHKEKDSQLIEALRCLYFGRVSYFFKEIADLDPYRAEEKVLEQAKNFFDHRNYLLDKIK